jgi:hypothetical protein
MCRRIALRKIDWEMLDFKGVSAPGTLPFSLLHMHVVIDDAVQFGQPKILSVACSTRTLKHV